MVTRLKIGDFYYEPASFTVDEEATPLGAEDTSGSVGSIRATIREADPYAPVEGGMLALRKFGMGILVDRNVELSSTDWGVTFGRVASANRTESGDISLVITSRLGVLNAYNVKAQPFVGTLGNLFRYYCSLAGVSASEVTVESALANRPVLAPGWVGELWFNLKQMCQAQQVEIALVGSKITLRRIRLVTARRGYEVAASSEVPIPTLAQSVEVYQYETQAITNQLVYPPGGWVMETEVLNVNAGETAEYTLELSASVSSIMPPEMLTSVPPQYGASSVYTVVASDGLPVTPAMWKNGGGNLTVEIAPDTSHLIVKLRGATGVPTKDGSAATNFSIALGSDTSGNRYSTLRIVGTGVSWVKRKLAIPTGVPASRTGTEVGTTIDNPFLQTLNQAYRAGVPAAASFAYPAVPSTGTIISLTGDPTQTLGRINGARVWDQSTRRYARIRSANTSPDAITYTGDNDLTHDDVEGHYLNLTYGDVQQIANGLTYQDDYLSGLKDV